MDDLRDLDDANIHPDITGEDDGELAEELAATTTIEQLFDTFLENVQEIYDEALDVALDANPVKTYIEMMEFGQDVSDLAYRLKEQLLANLANRAEQFPVQGDTLLKQVIEDPEEEN